jgi:hypothetical protein
MEFWINGHQMDIMKGSTGLLEEASQKGKTGYGRGSSGWMGELLSPNYCSAKH